MTASRWISLGTAACVAAALAAPGAAEPQSRPHWETLGQEVVHLVRDHFHDGETAKAWTAKHAGYAAGVGSREQFTERTRQALAALKASHTGYFTPLDAKSYGLMAIFEQGLGIPAAEWDSPGADFAPGHFVRSVFAGGGGDAAGLRRGDKILSADGTEFHPVASFQGKAGRPLELMVERKPGATPLRVALTPRRVNAKREWLAAQQAGARLIARNGRKAAYVPYFSGAGEEHQRLLEDLLAGPLHDADALVLDFRDGFGGCNPAFVNLFNKAPAVITQSGRTVRAARIDGQWRKPVVVLINGGTTSGKEVVAYSLKKHRLGTLVGQRTAGAVLAGRCFLLSDRSLMYLAVAEILVDGEYLEGVGVAPDVEVADDLPYADGADPQLDKAVELATR